MSKPRSKIRGHKRGCEGKQRFETMEAAEKAAYRPRSALRTGAFLQAYKCHRCDGFHYGHPRGWKR